MPEPHATTAGTAAGAITGTLTGSFIGLAYDTLLGGLLGGLLSLMYLAPMPPSRMAASLAGATLAGGAFGPAAVAAAHQFAPWLDNMGTGPLRMSAAIAVGLVAQVAIPAALAALKRKSETA